MDFTDMYTHLAGLRIVEGASFIAAPSCGLYLSQLGAEVIRFDQIGGSLDFGRWPKAENGASLYWENLNRGKRSIAIDLRNREGRELAVRLATAPGDNCGIFLTNYPAEGFLSHENLVKHRADQLTVRIMGWSDGATALDYTINAAVGVPDLTGPSDDPRPVNHVLPAWDLLTGSLAALSLVAAERRRRESGQGDEIRVPLSDVAISSLANLGQVGEVMASNADRPRVGNDLFGAFGRDFVTADGKRLMVVAITRRQWDDLIAVLGLQKAISSIESRLGRSLGDDEGLRFDHRDELNALVGREIASRTFSELQAAFEGTGACWAPYRTLRHAIYEEPRLVRENPVFASIEHPSGLTYPAPGFAPTFGSQSRSTARPAPRLGADTEQILAEVLGCSQGEIASLHDRGVVASAGPSA